MIDALRILRKLSSPKFQRRRLATHYFWVSRGRKTDVFRSAEPVHQTLPENPHGKLKFGLVFAIFGIGINTVFQPQGTHGRMPANATTVSIL